MRVVFADSFYYLAILNPRDSAHARALTDCITFLVMNDTGSTEALTGDHHFRQAGFQTLL